MKTKIDLSVSWWWALAFTILKLCKVINWSWWWIFSPVWIPLIIMLIIVAIVVVVKSKS